jgi:hypothetical protein
MPIVGPIAMLKYDAEELLLHLLYQCNHDHDAALRAVDTELPQHFDVWTAEDQLALLGVLKMTDLEEEEVVGRLVNAMVNKVNIIFGMRQFFAFDSPLSLCLISLFTFLTFYTRSPNPDRQDSRSHSRSPSSSPSQCLRCDCATITIFCAVIALR